MFWWLQESAFVLSIIEQDFTCFSRLSTCHPIASRRTTRKLMTLISSSSGGTAYSIMGATAFVYIDAHVFRGSDVASRWSLGAYANSISEPLQPRA